MVAEAGLLPGGSRPEARGPSAPHRAGRAMWPLWGAWDSGMDVGSCRCHRGQCSEGPPEHTDMQRLLRGQSGEGSEPTCTIPFTPVSILQGHTDTLGDTILRKCPHRILCTSIHYSPVIAHSRPTCPGGRLSCLTPSPRLHCLSTPPLSHHHPTLTAVEVLFQPQGEKQGGDPWQVMLL